ncbi:putative transferase [Serinicoccus hydrothermalis]|uniref:Putative transferase n=1 Tax=Serinicoccus hydrothermalis TaxID=1758689 RepID=A0A1B1NGB7_9MICO|nr:putative transferase [Serinicoccus hydrothermalis]
MPAVLLRPLRPDDLAVHASGCDDLVDRWVNGGRTSTTEEHLAWLERMADAWRARADVVDLAVEDAATGEHVGVVGIQRGLSYLRPGEVNLTYTLYAGRRGCGHATAATRAAMRLAAAQAPVTRFLIRCAPANHASAAVARRLGFRHVGIVAEPDGWSGDRYVCDVENG